MLAMIFGFVQSVVSGLVGPVFTYLGKKQDVTLDGFKEATGADEKAYEAYLTYMAANEAAQAKQRSWWGPQLLVMIVGGTASIHTAMVFLDSTFQFGCGHHGCLQVATLPPDYLAYEKMIINWLFGIAVAAPLASSVSAWLHRK